jgi:hypothetical protein
MTSQNSQKIVSLLDEFKDATEQENIETAIKEFDDIVEIYEDVREEQTRLALRIRFSDSDENEVREAADDYLRSFLQSRALRYRFRLLGGLLVESFDDLSESGELAGIQSDLEDAVDDLKEVEPELEESQEQAEQEIQKLEIPPNIQVLSAEQVTPEEVEVREETDVEVVLSNIGDSTAEGVTVTLEADNMEISTEKFSVGTMSPEVNERLRPTVTPTEAGSVELSVQADSDNAGSATDSVSIISIEAGEDSGDRKNRRDLGRGETGEQPRRRRDRGRGDPETGSRRRDRGRDSGRDGSGR